MSAKGKASRAWPAEAPKSGSEVTRLLEELGTGNQEALGRLIPLVQRELLRLARGYMARERSDHTLQPTALVNEALLTLMGQNISWESRSHFYAVAALAMRQVLVAYARRHRARKRGGALARVTFSEEMLSSGTGGDEDLVALDEALQHLARENPRQAKVVELRYFGGLGVDETAEVLGVSPRTVKRDWLVAKAWLLQKLQR